MRASAARPRSKWSKSSGRNGQIKRVKDARQRRPLRARGRNGQNLIGRNGQIERVEDARQRRPLRARRGFSDRV